MNVNVNLKVNLPEQVRMILSTLNLAGFEAYAVGGCVRDSLIGEEPGDWDITTSAKPQEVKKLFRRTVDTGIQHGTVTVLMPKMSTRQSAGTSKKEGKPGFNGYEVTTFRIDGEYLDGRHPKEVIFTPSLHEDLARRDFTINAMAVGLDGQIIDDFGGLEDLEGSVIRAVGDPIKRFTEDALRMLRAIRFAARLGFRIEENTYNAIRTLAPNLQKVSKERIEAELTKLLLSDHPENMQLVFNTGLALYIAKDFYGILTAYRDPAILPEEMHEKEMDIRLTGGLPKDKGIVWGTFLRTVPSKSKTILRELKADNLTMKTAEAIAGLFHEVLPSDDYQLRKALSLNGYQVYGTYLSAAHLIIEGFACDDAMKTERASKISALQSNMEALQKAEVPLTIAELSFNGEDLQTLGIKKGPIYGKILGYLLDQVLMDPSLNNHEKLLELVRRYTTASHFMV